MKSRVVGEEIEWGGGCRLAPGGPWLPVGDVFDKIIEEAFLHYEHSDKTSGIFLPNGARVYHETTGRHLETASPECSSAREAVKLDKWSEAFVCWVAKIMKEKHDTDVVFYKKNTDGKLDNDATRGCHENYFSEKIFGEWLKNSDNILRNSITAHTPASIDPEIDYFILFLITRQILTGAGGVMLYSLKNGKDVYEISPRTNYIDAIITVVSTSSSSVGRPIIHMKKEALSHDDQYFRNHLILSDANMADLSIFLKFGTTSAVIEMLEENFWDRRLCLYDTLEAPKLLKAISRDLTLNNVPIRLRDGKNYTALQIQEKFYRNWRRYLKYTNQGGEKTEIAEKWQEILSRLKVDDERLYSQLDWKIKMRLIKDFMDKKGLPLNHEKVINLDNVYHSPDPELSFYYRLKNRPGAEFESLVDEGEIFEADKTPPENRAKLRGYLKKLFDELDLVSIVNWEWVTFKLNAFVTEYKINMVDPRLSSVLSLKLPINAASISHLNNLRPGALVI